MVIKGQFPSLYYIVREGCIANPPAECLRLGHWAIDKHIRISLGKLLTHKVSHFPATSLDLQAGTLIHTQCHP